MANIFRYIDRKDYQYAEMDTDSAYMALSGPLHQIIKPHLREQFFKEYGDWFPREACDNHRQHFIEAKLNGRDWIMANCCKQTHKYDQRTPGLFKEEFAGIGIISLNSKTYYCWGENSSDDKYRSKGLSRTQNKLLKDQYASVLRDRVPVSGENRGFCKKNNTLLTYSQCRSGLNYFYAKRLVLQDGVSTKPLNI